MFCSNSLPTFSTKRQSSLKNKKISSILKKPVGELFQKSRNIFLYPSLDSLLKIPILGVSLISEGSLFQAHAPLNVNEFFRRDSLVGVMMILPFLLSLHRQSAKYSGSLVDLTLYTASRVW